MQSLDTLARLLDWLIEEIVRHRCTCRTGPGAQPVLTCARCHLLRRVRR